MSSAISRPIEHWRETAADARPGLSDLELASSLGHFWEMYIRDPDVVVFS